MEANQPLFQSKKNVESSPVKKTKPIISSNSATIRGHSLLIFAWTGCSMMVVMKMIIIIIIILLFLNF